MIFLCITVVYSSNSASVGHSGHWKKKHRHIKCIKFDQTFFFFTFSVFFLCFHFFFTFSIFSSGRAWWKSYWFFVSHCPNSRVCFLHSLAKTCTVAIEEITRICSKKKEWFYSMICALFFSICVVQHPNIKKRRQITWDSSIFLVCNAHMRIAKKKTLRASITKRFIMWSP